MKNIPIPLDIQQSFKTPKAVNEDNNNTARDAVRSRHMLSSDGPQLMDEGLYQAFMDS